MRRVISVTNPGCLCLSWILIYIHLGSRLQPKTIYRIFGLQQQQQKRRVKKICCPTFYCSHKYHEIKIFYFWTGKEMYVLFLSKTLSPNSLKYGFGIRTNPFLDPGVKKAPDPGSESAALSVIVKNFVNQISPSMFSRSRQVLATFIKIFLHHNN